MLSGQAIFAPMAAGKPNPIVPDPPEDMKDRGCVHLQRFVNKGQRQKGDGKIRRTVYTARPTFDAVLLQS